MTAGLPEVSRVARVADCQLVAGDGGWRFAQTNAIEIDRHWERRRAENPSLFNGGIFILGHADLTAHAFDGRLIGVEFKQFLYWKEHGYPDMSVRDTFGSALIRSSEGHIILGRQREGNINAGLAYLPGGFIDARDVGPDGSIDIAASIAREVTEETGLTDGDLTRMPGFILTFAGPMLSIAVEYRAWEEAEDLTSRIRASLARDAGSELEDVVVIRELRDVEGLAMPLYAEVLLAKLLSPA